jgi:hypothetical protein
LGIVIYLWDLYNMQTLFLSVLQKKSLVSRSGRRVKFNDLRRSSRLHLPVTCPPKLAPYRKISSSEQHILDVINKWLILCHVYNSRSSLADYTLLRGRDPIKRLRRSSCKTSYLATRGSPHATCGYPPFPIYNYLYLLGSTIKHSPNITWQSIRYFTPCRTHSYLTWHTT